MRTFYSIVVVTLAMAASSAEAQRRQPIGPYAEGGAVFVAMKNAKTSGVAQGVGFDALAGYAFGPFGIAGGFQRSVHNVDRADQSLQLDIIFIEPRYEFDLGAGTVTPFVFGRFGGVEQRLTSSTRNIDSRGFMMGGGAGMRLQVAPALSFNLSGLVNHMAMQDVRGVEGDVSDVDPAGAGLVARAGFSFRFGQGMKRPR